MINFGATLLAPGQTAFRLWAPDCDAVSVEVKDQGTFPMLRNVDDIFVAEIPVDAGTRYRYRVSSDLAVPDPASRAQDIDVHDYSIVIDQSYPWQHDNWEGRPWHETVIYELHTGVFGGFNGVKMELARLVKLGITAIELMPIADFPGTRNWGYDGVLPYAPDATYGTPDELKEMIDTAHSLGLMVFLDVVYNHFGPDGNYLNAYASSFFAEGIATPWGNAIDFRRPQVRRFFIENALYWLNDYRMDGLRFDAVHAILDPTFLTDMAAEIRSTISPERHVHLILENENNDATLINTDLNNKKFNAQWTDDWHHCLHVLLTGEYEGYYQDFKHPAQQLARCMAEGFAYQGEPSYHGGGVPRGKKSTHLPTTAFVICLQNHDQVGNRAMGERLTTLAHPDALRAATLLLLMTPQIPMLFMGEEWGAKDPFLFFTDHHSELADTVREGRRTEFASFAAFADPVRRAVIPDPNSPETFAASVPRIQNVPMKTRTEMLALYETGLQLRARHITSRIPGTVSIGAEALNQAAICAAWRMGDGATLTIASNLDSQSLVFAADTDILISSDENLQYDGVTLPGFTTYVWLRNK
jgi:maltooligosyltrehalose trehalohydrolase